MNLGRAGHCSFSSYSWLEWLLLFPLGVAFLLSFSSAVYAQSPTVFGPGDEMVDLAGHIEFLEDKNASLTMEEVIQEKLNEFQPTPSSIPNFGLTQNVYFFKVNVRNESELNHFVLELGYPHLDEVTVAYRQTDGALKKIRGGDQLNFDVRYRPHRTISFPLEISSGTSEDIYLRVRSSGSIQLPLKVFTERSFGDHMAQENIGNALFAGIMLVMILFNALLYLVFPDKAYLIYVGFVVSNLITQMAVNGTLFAWILPDSPWLANTALVSGVFLTAVFVNLFTESFLELAKIMPRLNNTILGLCALSALGVVLSSVLPYAIMVKICLIVSVVTCLLALVAGVISYRAGYEPALYFLVAWVAFFGGVIVFSLKSAGILPSNIFTDKAVLVGSALEVTLLSIALAHRFKLIQDENTAVHLEVAKAEQGLQRELQTRVHLISGAAHHLNNPMNVVSLAQKNVSDAISQVAGLVELVFKNETSENGIKVRQRFESHLSDIDRSLDSMEGGTNKASVIIREMLGVSGINGSPHRELNLASVLNSSLDRIREEIGEETFTGYDCKKTFEPIQEARIVGNPYMFGQVFRNVFENAWRFAQKDAGPIEIETDMLNGVARIVVNNPAMAIAAEQRAVLFEPTQGSGSKRGTGLSVCKHLISQLGGDIEVTDFGETSGRVSVTIEVPVVIAP